MINNAYAQTTATTTTAPAGTAPGAPPPQAGMMSMLTLFAPMFLVIYFFIIRPQNKKMKEHKKILDQVKSGDEIVTASGIFGTVTGVTDTVVTVEIADKVRIKMLKGQVASVTAQK